MEDWDAIGVQFSFPRILLESPAVARARRTTVLPARPRVQGPCAQMRNSTPRHKTLHTQHIRLIRIRDSACRIPALKHLEHRLISAQIFALVHLPLDCDQSSEDRGMQVETIATV